MKLIKKIEINYLRSLYNAIVDDAGDLNVIFGRNDSGKSNVLRALSLFFNDEIEPNNDLDFELDMSDRRKQEARDAKGRQFIWIKITFRVPKNYVDVLGDEIAIKRQWNRDGDMNETVFPSMKTPGQQSRLTRFLNDIDFTYIPAIKDLTVYADLIERMYGAASDTEVVRNATSTFVDAIEAQTTSLSKQLADLFGGPARLSPPTEMSRLFRNLDFAHGEDGHSMLRQKGDGVKARHLPELLRFINEKETRKKLYIWGFEEPENSLDLGAAEGEARRFASFSKRADTQVFITSHSPAFYLAQSDDMAVIKRYFIDKQVKSEDGAMLPTNAATLINSIDDAEQKMDQAGLLQLPFVIRQMSEHRAMINEKEYEAEQLRSAIQKLTMPTLFVEGEHDVKIFSDAFVRGGWGDQVAVKPLGGAPQTSEALFAAVLEQGGLNASAPALFLFDNDKAGRGAFRKICTKQPSAEPMLCKKMTYAWNIPWTGDFARFAKKMRIQPDQAFFTCEFLYPATEAASLIKEIIDSDNSQEIKNWSNTVHGDYWNSLGQERVVTLQRARAPFDQVASYPAA